MKKTKAMSPISDELIDAWLKQGRKPEDIQGLLKQFTKQVVERAMQGEMAEHLGYEKHDPEGNNSGNSRNGTTLKTLKGDFGEVEMFRLSWKWRGRASVKITERTRETDKEALHTRREGRRPAAPFVEPGADLQALR